MSNKNTPFTDASFARYILRNQRRNNRKRTLLSRAIMIAESNRFHNIHFGR